MNEEEIFPYFYQITLGLDYLHKQGIAHRDIKPENILICEVNSIKICDFNWAIKLIGYQTADPILCGTTEYMPPEVILRKRHDYRTDIWSLGIVFYVNNSWVFLIYIPPPANSKCSMDVCRISEVTSRRNVQQFSRTNNFNSILKSLFMPKF